MLTGVKPVADDEVRVLEHTVEGTQFLLFKGRRPRWLWRSDSVLCYLWTTYSIQKSSCAHGEMLQQGKSTDQIVHIGLDNTIMIIFLNDAVGGFCVFWIVRQEWRVNSQLQVMCMYVNWFFSRSTNIFCDKYDSSQQTYCKRLRVLCPEHTKEPKVVPIPVVAACTGDGHLLLLDWSTRCVRLPSRGWVSLQSEAFPAVLPPTQEIMCQALLLGEAATSRGWPIHIHTHHLELRVHPSFLTYDPKDTEPSNCIIQKNNHYCIVQTNVHNLVSRLTLL